MPKEISFGALVNSITPVNTIADRTLTFVYGPEHQRISQRVQLSSNAPSSMQAGQTWYLNGEDSQGLTYEKEAKTNGIIEHKHYLSAGGIVFAMHVSRTGNINNADPLKAAETLNYLHHDYLGSIVAISNEAGQVTERLAFDPWGKRRYPNGLPDANDNINGLTTERGFTMHEHLDEMGLIHMNGRIYDPLIGRFMSADPFIQAPGNLQSHNRYSYVMNNPLNLTDPSGYFSFKRLFRVAVIVAAAYFTGGAATQFFIGQGAFTVTATGFSLTTGASIAVGAAGGFAAGFVGAALSGGSLESALKGGLIGALSGGAFGAVGASFQAGSFGSYAGHAAAGCISAVAGGGACGTGAASALFGKFTTNAIGDSSFISGDLAKGVATAVAGGVGSVIVGGKFENGAITAAYGYLFNHLSSIGVNIRVPFIGGAKFAAGVSYENGEWDAGLIIESDIPVVHVGKMLGKATLDISYQQGDFKSNARELSMSFEAGAAGIGGNIQRGPDGVTGGGLSVGPQLGGSVGGQQTRTASYRTHIVPIIDKLQQWFK